MPDSRTSFVQSKFLKAAAELSADPFSKVTRTRQNYLLLTSAVALAVAKGILTVDNSSSGSLGLKFQKPSDLRSIVIVAICAILFYLTVFLLSAFQDMQAERFKMQASLEAPINRAFELRKSSQALIQEWPILGDQEELSKLFSTKFEELADRVQANQKTLKEKQAALQPKFDELRKEQNLILPVISGISSLRHWRMWIEIIVPSIFSVSAMVACIIELSK